MAFFPIKLCWDNYTIIWTEGCPVNNTGAPSEDENQLKCIKMLKDMIPSEDLKHLKYHKLIKNTILIKILKYVKML